MLHLTMRRESVLKAQESPHPSRTCMRGPACAFHTEIKKHKSMCIRRVKSMTVLSYFGKNVEESQPACGMQIEKPTQTQSNRDQACMS